MKKPSAIIIMGPPGSGKGTQAELLAEKLDIFHLETSEIIEKKLANAKKGEYLKVSGRKYFLVQEKKLRESGELMSPPLINFWVKEKIRELAGENKEFVASGSPRTLYEGKEIIPSLKRLYGLKNIVVISFKLSARESIWRNSRRKTCQLMRHPILYSKETSKLKKCPFDGSRLVIRKDDKPEIIKTRLKEYRERTLPLLDFYKKEKIKVIEVDGSPPPAEIFENILNALKRS